MKGKRWFTAATVALVCLTALAYSPALRGPQFFDDLAAIRDNPSIRHLWPITDPLTPPPHTALTGRPVVNLSLAFNYWLNTILGVDQSPDPAGVDKTVTYHAVNILLHIACGLLLLGIVRRTLRSGRFGDRWVAQADGIALLVAALWLLHPLNTEAVDYLTQRTEVIMAFCYLATLYCSIRAWEAAAADQPDRDRRTLAWLWAGVVACLTGMASKEVMISAPLMVILYDRAFRFDSWRALAGRTNPRRWFYLALFATLLVLGALMWGNPRGGTVGFSFGIPWYEYLHTQGWAIAHYLRLVLLPNALSVTYSVHPVPHWRGVPGLALLTLLAVITIAAWTRANRWGWLGFLGAWFFCILAPSSSIVPVFNELVAERRIYLPLAAVIVLLVVVADAALQYARSRRPVRPSRTPHSQLGPWLGAAALVLVLGGFTLQRSAIYGSAEAIWRDAVAQVPDNALAWNNLGTVVAALPNPRPAEAEVYYRKALSLDSSYVDAILNVAMSELWRHENVAAERHFRRILGIDSTNLFAVGSLGMLLLERGDTTAALPFVEKFAAAGGGPRAQIRLGQAYFAVGRAADGVEALRKAVAQDPMNTVLTVNVADLLAGLGRPAEAKALYQRALSIDPGNEAARAGLARPQ